jgi:23S rRNA pseudouridine1911/1915/1917 synthase
MNEPDIHELQAPPDCTGERVDQVAAELFPDYSRARLQKWIRDGDLTVDNEATRPARKLAGGEWLRLVAVLEPEGVVTPQDLPLDILHEDADLLVLDKPAGLVVHPAAGNPDGTLQNALLHHDPGLDALPRSGIVHRLDKDTSGVMVVARSLRAHHSLVAQLQSRDMSRIYEAVVHGVVKGPGSVEAPIGRHPVDRKRMAVVARGKPAASHYRVLRRFAHFTQLEVSLESGRTHQIRVHMRHLGWPLVGDAVYGKRLAKNIDLDAPTHESVSAFPRQALHARTLCLQHPADGRECRYTAPLPADLRALLDVLLEGDPP